MRKKIVAGNWKMNTSLQEGIQLAKEINEEVKNLDTGKGVAIAPSFIHLSEVRRVINEDKICLTAQNCAAEKSGAYTGEVSAAMLRSIGVKSVIIGHSERRAYYGDTDKILAEKLNRVFENEMHPVFCCGEQLEERKADKHIEVVKEQIKKASFHLSPENYAKVVIAYEPVWAIGTGETASADQAQEMHKVIRETVAEKYGQEIAGNMSILYGGSVKPGNAEELFSKPDVDGGLIGGASMKADSFAAIIKA
ncbi:MAG: triose-phosphate isomerase [Bacteroidota bacterium]|nr:triose-phosphate isomerase [Bacteroidota bacterium]